MDRVRYATWIVGFNLLVAIELAQGTNCPPVQPSGFEDITFGMTTQQVASAHANLELRDISDGFPVGAATELLTKSTYFTIVEYEFDPEGALDLITFWPDNGEHTSDALRGFLKGAIAKFGTNYVARYVPIGHGQTKPILKTALLKWDSTNCLVAVGFVSDAAKESFKQGGGSKLPFPYLLRIFTPAAVTNHFVLTDITDNLPPGSDTTGLAFTNFPAFLDDYAGPIWE